jgi:hypothetical protein
MEKSCPLRWDLTPWDAFLGIDSRGGLDFGFDDIFKMAFWLVSGGTMSGIAQLL